jgi:8-oxo-dGTP diphosphatase
MSTPVVEVAVCVVQTPDGRVLLAERTSRQMAAGFWELPGGKIEAGEAPAQAAARELTEETGLTPVGVTPWLSYEHQFPTKRLRLHFFRTLGWQGSPHGREGQRLAWVDPRAPHVGPVLPSNNRALFALSMPRAYMVADFSAHSSSDGFLASVHDALSGGATLMRVRMTAISPGQTASLLARVAGLAAAFPAASILSSTTMDARRAGLAGVHSGTSALRQLTARPPVRLWSATCHDEADLARAVWLGADFVVLSPILYDPDLPGQASIGWDGLRRYVAASPVRIYAHGGLTQADAQAARQAGAAGLVLACRSARSISEHGNGAKVMPHPADMRV